MARRSGIAALFLLFAGTSQVLLGCSNEYTEEQMKEGSVCFQTPNNTKQAPQPSSGNDTEDTLTVMIQNTYMIEQMIGLISIKKMPNVYERAEGFVKWFNSLASEAVPDVLILNEIWSNEGELIVRKICSNDWRRNEPLKGFDNKFIECCEGSHFAFSTHVNNARTKAGIFMSGGVVVLVKKGLEMTSAHDEQFANWKGKDIALSRGFWAVKANKGNQSYNVIGMHTIAFGKYRETRLQQLAQVRKWVDDNVKDKERLLFAGDLNVFTHETPHVGPGALETDAMLKALGTSEAPATGGTLVKKGFWLPLDNETEFSWDVEKNHLVGNLDGADQEEFKFSQMYDWILVPGSGDRFDSPKDMRVQVVPALADECYASEEKPGTKGDDLSDHYGKFAQICYKGNCPQLQGVDGHRGANQQVPSPLNCP
jgi:hypothetical protein